MSVMDGSEKPRSEERHPARERARMNGEVRDREKVMRGLKRIDTLILKGVQIYHNYIKPTRRA